SRRKRAMPEKALPVPSLKLFPCLWHEKHQKWKQFQPSCQHIQREDKLCTAAENSKIPHRSYELKPWTNIIQCRRHACKVGYQIMSVKSHKKYGQSKDNHIQDEKYVRRSDYFVLYQVSVHLNFFNTGRMDD